MKTSGILLAVLIAAATAGCYTYSPAPAGEVPDAGSLVRVQLTEDGARGVRLDRSGSDELFGRVRRTNGDSVTLSVRRSAGDRVDALGVRQDSVTVALSSVGEWRRQELSVFRTAGVVAGVAGAAVLTTQIFVQGEGPERDTGFLDDRDTEGAIRPASSVGWTLPVP